MEVIRIVDMNIEVTNNEEGAGKSINLLFTVPLQNRCIVIYYDGGGARSTNVLNLPSKRITSKLSNEYSTDVLLILVFGFDFCFDFLNLRLCITAIQARGLAPSSSWWRQVVNVIHLGCYFNNGSPSSLPTQVSVMVYIQKVTWTSV